MTIDLDKEEIDKSTKLIIKLLKDELTEKYSLTENHVIRVFIYEKKPKLSEEEAKARRAESNRKSYEKRKENEKAQRNAVATVYNLENEEKVKERDRAYSRKYYENNKEKLKERRKAKRELLKNKENNI